MTPPSPLARHARTTATSPEDLEAMRRRAWRQQGVVVLKPEDIVDPRVRQVLIGEAVKRYGPSAEVRR